MVGKFIKIYICPNPFVYQFPQKIVFPKKCHFQLFPLTNFFVLNNSPMFVRLHGLLQK